MLCSKIRHFYLKHLSIRCIFNEMQEIIMYATLAFLCTMVWFTTNVKKYEKQFVV
jgi:hypothetical protein